MLFATVLMVEIVGCAAMSNYRRSVELQESHRFCEAARNAEQAYLAMPNNDAYYAHYCDLGMRCFDMRSGDLMRKAGALPDLVPAHEEALADLESLLDTVFGFSIHSEAVRKDELVFQLNALEQDRKKLLATLKDARADVFSRRKALVERYEGLIDETTAAVNDEDFDQAGELFARASALWPKTETLNQISWLFHARERLDDASPRTSLEVLQRSYAWYERVPDVVEKHIRLANKQVEAGEKNVDRAKREIDRGRWDRARSYLAKAVETDGEHPHVSSYHRYIDTCTQAESLQANGEELRAIGEYRTADGMNLDVSIAGKRTSRLISDISRRHLGKAKKAQDRGATGQALMDYLCVLRVDPESAHALAGIQRLFEMARTSDRVRIGVSIRGGSDTPAGSLRANILEALIDGELAEEARISDVSRYLGNDDLGFNLEVVEDLAAHFDYVIDVDVIAAYSDSGETLASQRDKQYVERYETRVVPNPEWDRYQKQLAEQAGNSVGGYVAEQAGGGLAGGLLGLATASAVENAVEPPKTITVQEPIHAICTYQESRCHAMAVLKSQIRLMSLPGGDELDRQVLSAKEESKDTGRIVIAGDCRKAGIGSEQCTVLSEYEVMETATSQLTSQLDSICTNRLTGKNRIAQAASLAESRGDVESAIDLYFQTLVVRYPSDNWREPMMAIVRLAGEDYFSSWEEIVRTNIR